MSESVRVPSADYDALRTLAGFIFALFTLFGVLSNTLLIVVFYKGRDVFNSIPFYIISYQMIVCDFLIYIPQLSVVLPSTLLDYNDVENYKDTFVFNALAALDSAGFYATLHFTFLMAVNRFAVINFQKLNVVFQIPLIFLVVCVTWAFNFGLVAIEEYYCPKSFNTEYLFLYLNCSQAGELYMNFRYYWTLVIPVAMFLIYFSIFVSIRKRRLTTTTTVVTTIAVEQTATTESRKRVSKDCRSDTTSTERRRRNCERALIAQAAIICGVLELETVVFYVVPLLSRTLSPYQGLYLNIVVNCLVILNNSVHPIVYFGFNREIRRISTAMFRRKRK